LFVTILNVLLLLLRKQSLSFADDDDDDEAAAAAAADDVYRLFSAEVIMYFYGGKIRIDMDSQKNIVSEHALLK